jgi:hypothetical protein
MLDENNSVFYAKPIARNPGDFLTVADIATAITPPGADREKMISHVSYCARMGYLMATYRETEGRKAYLYPVSTILVAEALLRLFELGVSDAAAARAVSNAFYVWKEGDPSLSYPPAALVLHEYVKGVQDWTLEVWTLRHDTGRVVHTARLYMPQRQRGFGLGYDLRDYAQRAVVAIDLADVLDRINAPGDHRVN